jgi:hypothetical protein
MRVILKPAGAIIVIGATVILAVVALTRPQKAHLQQPDELAASALFKPKNLVESRDKVNPINLTEVGKSDWVCWGTNDDLKSVVRKADGGNLISDYKLVLPDKSILGMGQRGPTRGMTWSNGTPTSQSSVAYGGVYVGAANGFQLTVPAKPDNKPKKLRVYVAGFKASGEFSATMTADTPPRTEMKEMALGGGYYTREYTVEFKGTTPSQNLEITWKMGRGEGNVSLLAAALE